MEIHSDQSYSSFSVTIDLIGREKAFTESLVPAGNSTVGNPRSALQHELDEATAPVTIKVLEPSVMLEAWKLPSITEYQKCHRYTSNSPLLI